MMYRSKGSNNVMVLCPEYNEREMWKQGSDGQYRMVRKQDLSDRDMLLEMHKVCRAVAKGDLLEIVSDTEVMSMESA